MSASPLPRLRPPELSAGEKLRGLHWPLVALLAMLGVVGYAGESSYDGTLVSHHVLTAKGIAGRDVLDRTFEDGGAAGDGAPITRRQSATGLLPAGGPRRSPAMLAPTIQGIPFVP